MTDLTFIILEPFGRLQRCELHVQGRRLADLRTKMLLAVSLGGLRSRDAEGLVPCAGSPGAGGSIGLMRTASEPAASFPYVRGRVLPVLLASLLGSGRWQHPGDDVLRRALPWFEAPLVFLHSAGAMERESAFLDEYASDDWASRYFHVTRTGQRLALPWLDAGLAFCIAVNRVPGDDVAIALDYRSEDGSPMVVASDAWTYPRGHLWRPVAASFDAFASMLCITP